MGLRFLFVIDHYLPILGGAEIQTQLLGRKLVQRGHEVAIATAWQPGLPEYENDSGVNIHRIKGLTTRVPWFFTDPDWRRYPPPFPDPGYVLELGRLMRDYQPDVVNVYGWLAYSCAAALPGKKIPLILSSRDYGYSCATRLLMYYGRELCGGPSFTKCLGCAADYYGPLKALATVVSLRMWRGLLIRKTRAFHSVSTFVQHVVRRDLRRVQSAQGRDDTITDVVIYNLRLETDEGAPDPAYLKELPAEPFLLFVGTLDYHKGLTVLMEAYERLDSPPPLVLIGIATPGTPAHFPPGMRVLQDVPHPTVMAAWERCLFGLVPSLCPDSLPNVVLEAMSKGKPVVGSRAGGIPDMVVDGETGFLVPLGDVDALATAMSRLIQDEALRERFSRAAQERIKQFFPDAIVPRYEELARQLSGKTGEKRQR